MEFKSFHTDPQYDNALAEELTDRMAPRFNKIRNSMQNTFMMNEDEIRLAMHSPFETMQYKLGEIVNDALRLATQKDLRRILGIRIRPMNYGRDPATIVPNTVEDIALLNQIMAEHYVRGNETIEQTRERLMQLVNQMTGTQAKAASEAIVTQLLG